MHEVMCRGCQTLCCDLVLRSIGANGTERKQVLLLPSVFAPCLDIYFLTRVLREETLIPCPSYPQVLFAQSTFSEVVSVDLISWKQVCPLLTFLLIPRHNACNLLAWHDYQIPSCAYLDKLNLRRWKIEIKHLFPVSDILKCYSPGALSLNSHLLDLIS